MLIRTFQILSAVFAAAMIYFWWSNNFDFAFAGMVLAICSLFLSMRFQLKASTQEHAAQREAGSQESD